MTKIQVTAQQRANALDALNNMWPSVPSKNVHKRLGWWRADTHRHGQVNVNVTSGNTKPDCGTVCCFGGWCAWWPAFQAQGVYADKSGYPKIAGVDHNTDFVLFGSGSMFSPRDYHDADEGFKGSDHKLVTRRLKWLIKNSEVVA